MKRKSYFVVTFGCQANFSDSERVAGYLEEQGMGAARNVQGADWVVVNTCTVRQMAEDRVYGLLRNLEKQRQKTGKPVRITVTGCLVGMALREKSGKMLRGLRKDWPMVDEWLPVEEVGLGLPLRRDETHALVPISFGCNNYCSYCVVPFTRGREVSRPFEEIVSECKDLAGRGYKSVMLLGQNVNSYGTDLVLGKKGYKLPNGKVVKPVMVKHLGKMRIPTLFPVLLETICLQCPEFTQIEFMSANPWDFSDELIEVISKYSQISRRLHLPVQSGSNKILRAMNRWYTQEEYLDLVGRIRDKVPGVEFSTDIIVGFLGETEEDFADTVDLVKRVGFVKSYTARYSPRPMTAANKLEDDVSYEEKKRRWKVIDQLVNG